MSTEAVDKPSALSFNLQIGLVRDTVTIENHEGGDLAMLKEIACEFVDRKFPEHGFYGLQDKLLLFRHDETDDNVLKLISGFAEVTEGALLEVVLSANTTMEDLQIRPHVLYVHSYKSPHFCDFCGEMLFGLVRQGLKCEGCGLNFHKRCAYKIPNNCNYTRRRRSSTSSNQAPFQSPTFPAPTERQISSGNVSSGNVSSGNSLAVPGMPPAENRNNRSKSWSGGRPLWMEKEYAGRIKVPHTFVVHNYTRPTQCQHCKKLLKGLFRQGSQCKDCKFNCHKKCIPQVAKDCQGEVKWVPHQGMPFYGDSDSTMDKMSIGEADDVEDGEDDDSEIPKPPLSPNQSSNIPLMRVVQSVKHTKRTGSKIIREGWMVHFTNRDHTRKRHYWRLDTKAITLFQSEMSTRYYKEVMLGDIMHVEQSKGPQVSSSTQNPCVFEVITAITKYYIGEDLSLGGQKDAGPQSAESGIGLEQAQCWEHAIRQALMPVTPQQSTEVGDNSTTDGSHKESKKKKVPTATLR